MTHFFGARIALFYALCKTLRLTNFCINGCFTQSKQKRKQPSCYRSNECWTGCEPNRTDASRLNTIFAAWICFVQKEKQTLRKAKLTCEILDLKKKKIHRSKNRLRRITWNRKRIAITSKNGEWEKVRVRKSVIRLTVSVLSLIINKWNDRVEDHTKSI